MKPIRILLHGFVLLVVNLVGVIGGFAMYYALGTKDQFATQLPVAVVLSIVLFVAWSVLFSKVPFRNLRLKGNGEYLLTGICSLLWNPIVFIPLHYFTQGYLTGGGNIISLAAFQIPVNAVAILVAWKVTQPKDGQLPAETAPGTWFLPNAKL